MFQWNENFETGISIIDTQYKKRVKLLNELAVHVANRSYPVQLVKVFNELTRYADFHFKTEEEIWECIFSGNLADEI